SFSCNLCERTFKVSQNLDHHMRTKHAAEIEKKNFVCDECGARLISSDSLRDHKRTHGKVHNAKTFECDICNEKFSFRDELRTHK
ncbi:hypothetical protein PFISCL1PPCAC_12227, partial [Pristionchus fissidentatus]